VADIRPFRGVRYTGRGASLQDVVSPPYDAIRAEEADDLRRRSPYNSVHLDLPQPRGDDPDDRYAAAAELVRSWLDEGILTRDDEPSLYVVAQTFRGPDGWEHTRRGFIALARLEDFASGVILPHEKTHAGPRADRLKLLRATHADLSPIFMLYPDPTNEVGAALTTAPSPAQPLTVRDRDGNVQQLSRLTGEAAAAAGRRLAGRRLFIADGHHRYETALAYRGERSAAGDTSADYVMVYLCSLDDPAVVILPTHRLLKGVAVPPPEELLARLRPTFAVYREREHGAEACELMLGHVHTLSDAAKVFGLYFPREEACVTLELSDPAAIARLVAEGLSPDYARLSTTLLHHLIFRDVLGMDPNETEGQIDYVTNLGEAMRALATGRYTLGAFINATPMAEVGAVAGRGETMPQKSTFFYPKPLTGLVFNAMEP
jgi:uncharacterized protein (DUF1015 family)